MTLESVLKLRLKFMSFAAYCQNSEKIWTVPAVNIFPKSHRVFRQIYTNLKSKKIRKNDSPKKNKSSISPPSLSSIPFDRQKHPNSPASLHSELLIENFSSDAQNSDSYVSFRSNADTIERTQRHKECARSAVNDPLINKRNIVRTESNTKSIPFVSASNRESGAQVRATANKLGNGKSLATSPSASIKCNSVFENQMSSDLPLLPERFLEVGSSSEVQRSILNCSKTLAGLHKLFDESRFCKGNQKALPFNSADSSGKTLQKDNSFCDDPPRNSDESAKRFEELKSNSGQVLHSTRTECKFTSFNFSLRLQNQGQKRDEDRDLIQRQAPRRLSTSSNAGTSSRVDKSCFFVQTTWEGRKCKSSVHIQHETNLTQEINFLTDYSSKSAPLESDSSDPLKSTTRLEPSKPACKSGNASLESTTRLESSKPRGIPTFIGRKLPAKVSVLLLNGPVRMNYTENISGKSQEILVCTSDVIEDAIQRDKGIQEQDIVKALLARSRPYIGKPVHIIFEPAKATETPSPADSGAGNPVPLHSSPAKHNLLGVKSKVASTLKYQAKDESDTDRTLCFNCRNSSDETIVGKQNARHNLSAKKPKPVSKMNFQPNHHKAAGKAFCSSSNETLAYKQKAKSNLLIKNPELASKRYSLPSDKKVALCSSSNETLVQRHKAKLTKNPKVAPAMDHQTNDDETDGDRTLCSNWENSSTETLVGEKNGQLKGIENRMPRSDSPAKQNKRLETPEPQAKKKLKIRLCRRRKSRTSLKHVNVKQIVNSVFGNFFHFYSAVGGHLKSGSVITKSNSLLWLREAGVATDPGSLEMATQLFKDTAGAKVVLNIFDYMKFLSTFARRLRMATVDLVGQLTIRELPRTAKAQRHRVSRRLKTLPQSKRPEQGRTGSEVTPGSQSLPNLKTPQSVLNS